MSNEFIGGRLCLDFANTVDWRTASNPEELLQGFGDLLAWSSRAGSVSEGGVRQLAAVAEARPRAAVAAFRRALELREALYRSFRAHAHEETPSTEDLALLAESYAEAIGSARLARRDAVYEWGYDEHAVALDRTWWPVALSAVDLLASPQLDRVRECEGRGCGWLFLDESRNHARRWCSPTGCGNRERVRRHYARTHRRD